MLLLRAWRWFQNRLLSLACSTHCGATSSWERNTETGRGKCHKKQGRALRTAPNSMEGKSNCVPKGGSTHALQVNVAQMWRVASEKCVRTSLLPPVYPLFAPYLPDRNRSRRQQHDRSEQQHEQFPLRHPPLVLGHARTFLWAYFASPTTANSGHSAR